MRLTPLDVQQRRFETAFRGYAPKEVEAFLVQVSADLEEAVKELLDLREELHRKNTRIEEQTERERGLHDALLAAQKVADELKTQAHKQAELIVAEAELRAEKILQDAQNRQAQLVGELVELRRQRLSLETELDGILDGHRKLLDALRSDSDADEKLSFLARKGRGEG
jgi:cell division initiation protein